MAISRAQPRRRRCRSSSEKASRRVSPERCPARTNRVCRPPAPGSWAERRGAVSVGGAGAGTGKPWLDSWRGAAHPIPKLCHPLGCGLGTSLHGPLHGPPRPSSPAQHHTYIESLFPQGWRVGRALVVGGEPLVHRGGLVDAARCRGLVILVEGAAEESGEVRGVCSTLLCSEQDTRTPSSPALRSHNAAQFGDRREPSAGHLLATLCQVSPALPCATSNTC